VKQSAGEMTGQIIIAGLTDNAADAPGPFGVYQYAPNAKMTRSVSASGGTAVGEEDWDFTAPSGERMQVHVKYEHAAANKGGGDVKFYNPSDPAKYPIFRTGTGHDITRNATTNPPDRVKEFLIKRGGGRIGAFVRWDGKSSELGISQPFLQPHGESSHRLDGDPTIRDRRRIMRRFCSSFRTGLSRLAASSVLAQEAKPEIVPCPDNVAQIATCYETKLETGAYVLAAMPKSWNGVLIVFAHGGPSLDRPSPEAAKAI
jgi:hypothetical protein